MTLMIEHRTRRFNDPAVTKLKQKNLTCVVIVGIAGLSAVTTVLAFPNRVLVENKSGIVIDVIVVEVDRSTIMLHDLQPGRTVVRTVLFSQDCSVSVHGRLSDGREFRKVGSYLTPGMMGERIRVKVKTNGRVRISQR